jgi:hypothetical protein
MARLCQLNKRLRPLPGSGRGRELSRRYSELELLEGVQIFERLYQAGGHALLAQM